MENESTGILTAAWAGPILDLLECYLCLNHMQASPMEESMEEWRRRQQLRDHGGGEDSGQRNCQFGGGMAVTADSPRLDR
jgi:hypothetical protein